jgi:glycerol transport system permease protein
VILTDPSWYMGYVNSIIYVVMNTVISITVALPAAYAFSRYRFLGDKHLFFWLLTNRMAPPAVFALPFFQLYSASACSTPTSPWRWRIACSTCRWRSGSWKASCAACPRKSTRPPISTAIPSRFFVKIFMPLIASGIGVAAFFCFMFSWVELLLSRTLTPSTPSPSPPP